MFSILRAKILDVDGDGRRSRILPERVREECLQSEIGMNDARRQCSDQPKGLRTAEPQARSGVGSLPEMRAFHIIQFGLDTNSVHQLQECPIVGHSKQPCTELLGNYYDLPSSFIG